MMNLLDKLNGLKLDNKKIALIVIVCVLIFYADFMFIFKLQLKGINATSPKITKIKKDMASLSKELSQMQDLQLLQKGRPEAAKHKEIISEDKILLLLQEISDLANKNKIKVIQINTSKQAKAQEETVAGEKLLSVLIVLDLSCDYHALGNFLNALEDSSQYTELQDMKILRDARNYLLENASLVLKAYVKK